jgi:hypothetical protein
MSQRLVIAKQLKLPGDEKAIANYSNPKFVLGDEWIPSLAPIITTQPASVSATVGEKVILTVGVAAIPASGHQWQRNGGNIKGATQSVYSIKSVRRRDAGVYRVVISNTAGKVTSEAARITVLDRKRRSP